MINPEISIIIPAYNAERFLAKTLASVASQSFSNFECIVVNDGSTDATSDIGQSYVAHDPRFRLLSQPNAGHSAAKNRGFSASSPSAPAVIFMDADDLWYPSALQTLRRGLQKFPDALAVHSLADHIDPDDQPLKANGFADFGRNRIGLNDRLEPVLLTLDQPTTFSVVAYEDRIFPSGTILYRRRSLESVGLFDTSLSQHEDTHLHLRLAATGNFAFIPEVLVLYRQHPNNWSKRNKEAAAAYWSMRNQVLSDLSHQHRQILFKTSKLFQHRKVAMWLNAANHDLSKGQFKKALRCYAHFAINTVRAVKIELTSK